MNRKNLQKMADYIRTIPQEKFNMRFFRRHEEVSHECGSVGCVLGHCTVLDKKPLPMLAQIVSWNSRRLIDFVSWGESFTGISKRTGEWQWCFAGEWSEVDNTPEGAARRIEWLLEHGLPKDWDYQMCQITPLCYKGGEE